MAWSAFIVLLLGATLSACTNAYGGEKITRELLCEGDMTKVYRPAGEKTGSETKVGEIFGSLLFGPTDKKETKFSERFSIKDSQLGNTGVDLRVTDTMISLASTPLLINEIEFIRFEIDRLTGKFQMEAYPLAMQSDEPGYFGIKADGKCQKLDPKKTLF